MAGSQLLLADLSTLSNPNRASMPYPWWLPNPVSARTMNLFGAYLALRNNSKAALLAAIEVYNKPQIAYRDECFVILLVNAWELLFKAVLSKNKVRIFKPKKRGHPYRSITIEDSMAASRRFFPSHVQFEPVAQNVALLVEYRNQAVHLYNQSGLNVVIYGLAQTSITNYRDLVQAWFNIDIAEEMTISLLPLALGPLPDLVTFLRNASVTPPRNREAARFLRMISDATQDLEAKQCDTGRFLTVFKVGLQSVKKVTTADIIVAIDANGNPTDGTMPSPGRPVDPNISHPLRQKNILSIIGGSLTGVRFTSHTFQAIIWHLDIKSKPHLCWRSDNGELTKYSHDVVAQIKQLSRIQIEEAVAAYRQHQERVRKYRGRQ